MTLLDISIINYFDKGLSWDIFVQGFVVTLVLLRSFLYLLYLIPSYYSANQSLLDFYLQVLKNKIINYFNVPISGGNDLIAKIIKFVQFISLSSIVIVISFMMGVIFSNVSVFYGSR